MTSKSVRAKSFGSHRRAYKRGTNREDERVAGLALGAPLDYGEMDPGRDCPDCGAFTTRAYAMDGDDYAATSTDCGTETGRWPPVDAR